MVKKEKSWGNLTRLEDMISALCHLFFQNGAISAFLEVTETIEILTKIQMTKTLIQMRILLLYMRKYGILANRKPLMSIALAQACRFYLLKHVFFGRMRRILKNNISCRNDIFLIFNMTFKTHRRTKK